MHKILVICDHKGFGSLLSQILKENGRIVELVSYNQVNRITKFDSYYLVVFCDRINFELSSGINFFILLKLTSLFLQSKLLTVVINLILFIRLIAF